MSYWPLLASEEEGFPSVNSLHIQVHYSDLLMYGDKKDIKTNNNQHQHEDQKHEDKKLNPFQKYIFIKLASIIGKNLKSDKVIGVAPRAQPHDHTSLVKLHKNYQQYEFALSLLYRTDVIH